LFTTFINHSRLSLCTPLINSRLGTVPLICTKAFRNAAALHGPSFKDILFGLSVAHFLIILIGDRLAATDRDARLIAAVGDPTSKRVTVWLFAEYCISPFGLSARYPEIQTPKSEA
jgi:hypothetical protein